MEAYAIELITVGFMLLGGVTLYRHTQRRRHDHFRKTYQAYFPRDLDHSSVLNFIRALSGLPTPKLLQPVHSVVLDVYADSDGLKHFLSVPGHVTSDVAGLFRTHIGGSLVEVQDDPVTGEWDEVAELGTSSAHVPLRIGSPDAVAATILSTFSGLTEGQAVLMQWVILPAHHHPTPDGPQAKAKYAEPMFLAVGRLASKGTASNTLIRRLYTGLSSTHAYGMRFKRQPSHSGRLRGRIRRRSGVLAFPAILNALELSVFIGYPFGKPNVPGIDHGVHLKADLIIPPTGIRLGTSTYRGDERLVAVPISGLLMHEWVLGGTGSGKSALLHNQAVDLMRDGYGLVVIEPKGDLARDVLNSIPESRLQDVIWFDPTDVNRPIGLNVLAGPDPERTAAHVTSLFKKLYGDSWGPRLEQILRYSVLTAAINNLTLYDVKQLLVNPDFRSRIVRATKDSEARSFWRRLEDGPDNAVDSVVNKLDAFVGFRAIRNIVGQVHGLNMEDVLRKRKILLVPLDAALLGEANAAMLGSMIVDKFWNEAQLRPVDKRTPVALMVDEFQRFLNMSLPVEDMFALARSYQIPLMVANQHTAQLSTSVLAAVKANARTKAVFALNPDDARKLVDNFSPLKPEDLMSLTQYEIAASIMTAQGPAPTATVRTPPPPERTGYGVQARELSRERYGRPVEDVEAELVARSRVAETERKKPTIGRVE